MFENGFPREWSTIRKLALLFRSVVNAVIPVLKTIIGNPIHILDALAKPAQALSVKLEPIQAGSGDPSPDNVRPISGHTSVNVIVSPTLNPADGTTYPIPLGQTVYGGTPDVVTGVLTVTWASQNVSVFSGEYGAASNGWRRFRFNTDFAIPFIGHHIAIGALCDKCVDMTANDLAAAVNNGTITSIAMSAVSESQICVAVPETTLEDANSYLTGIGGLQVVYPLATPTTIQLTPTQVELLLGENNLFSDGEMTLVYLADGNASDEEALNILLGGRYVNNHGEDEPTDREALNIILGGNER